jgi:hypothetical protein
MPTVTIGGVDYESYVDLADAQRYLAAQIEATAFLAATPDQQGAALVSMTRTIDRQTWQGTATDGYANGAWPRTGLFYPDGVTPVPPDVVPFQIIDAVCEGASLLINGSNLQDVPNTFNTQKSLKAGSVEVVNFRTTDPSPRFPQVVQELVGYWLGGGSGFPVGSVASGTGGRTVFNEQYNVNQGF